MPAEIHYYSTDDCPAKEVQAKLVSRYPAIAEYLVKGRNATEFGVQAVGDAPQEAEEHLSAEGITFYKHTCLTWTKEEMLEAPWLYIWFHKHVYHDAGQRHGNKPIMTGTCKSCGAGWMPGEVVRTDTRIKGVKKFGNLMTGETVVSSDVKAALLSEHLDGVRFIPILSGKKDQQDERHWILSAPTLASRANGSSWLTIIEDYQCRECSRSGWSTPAEKHGKLVYQNSAFPKQVDAFTMWEYFGKGQVARNPEESVLPEPRLVISQRIYRILKQKMKVRGVEFEPVLSL